LTHLAQKLIGLREQCHSLSSEEIKREIQLTDKLIDQIVYMLYGLTEEEIAIVEGRG